MKKLLAIALLLISCGAFAQVTQPTGAPNVIIRNLGSGSWDSAVYLPDRDTTFTPSIPSCIIIRQADGLVYSWTGGPWKVVGTPVWGKITGLLTNQIDLYDSLQARQRVLTNGYGWFVSGGAGTFDSAHVRKVDTMYRVNDSTVGYKINGIAYTALIRGTAAGGISSLVLTVPTVLFSSPVTFSNAGGMWTGTLALATQSANLFFASPASGPPAAPTMRAIGISDIPTGIPNANLQNSTLGLSLDNTTSSVAFSATSVALGNNIVLHVPFASSTVSGQLSSTDWNRFNAATTAIVTSVNGQVGAVNVQNADSLGGYPIDFTNFHNGWVLAIDTVHSKLVFQAPGSGTGITTLNGLNPVTQLFAIGYTGTSFNINSAIATHTFNIPIVNGADTGLVTPTRYNIWNGKVDSLRRAPGNDSVFQWNNGVKTFAFLDSSGVNSVSNSDGSLSISPTAGSVVASLNTSHSNTFSVGQNFNGSTSVFSGGITLASTFAFGTDNTYSIGSPTVGAQKIWTRQIASPAQLSLSSTTGNPVVLYIGGNPGITLLSTGQAQLNNYTTSSSFTGSPLAFLQTDASGNIIQTPISGIGSQTWQSTLGFGSTLDTTNTIVNTGQVFNWNNGGTGLFKLNNFLRDTANSMGLVTAQNDSSVSKMTMAQAAAKIAPLLPTFFLVAIEGTKPFHGSSDTIAFGTGQNPFTENDTLDFAYNDMYWLHANHEATLSPTDSIPVRTAAGKELLVPQSAFGGSGSQTLQQVITTGATMTKANTINNAGFHQYDSAGLNIFDSISIALALPKFDSVFSADNSIGSGTGASDQYHRYLQLLADKLRRPLADYSVSGTTMQVNGLALIPSLPVWGTNHAWAIIGYVENDIINAGNNVTWDTAHCGPIYRQFVDSLHARGCPYNKMVLRGPVWISPTNFANATLARQAQYQAMVQSIATTRGCIFVDCFNPFVYRGTSILDWDQVLHPNNDGHALIAQLIYNAIAGDSARSNGTPGFLNNRTTDINRLVVHAYDTASNKAVPLVVDTSGKVAAASPDMYLQNSTTLAQPKAFSGNISGTFSVGNGANTALPASIQLFTPGSAQFGSLRITAGPPAGWSGAGGNLTYSSGILHIYNYTYPSGPNGGIAFNEVSSGISMFGTATATGGPEVGQFNGGVSSNFMTIHSNLAGGIIGKTLDFSYQTSPGNGYGFIGSYDHTGAASMHLDIGGTESDTVAFGPATFSAPAKFQFNGSFYASGLAGIGTNPLTTSYFALPASTTSLSSLNIAAGVQPTTGHAGDFSYVTGHLWFFDGSSWHDLLAGGGGGTSPPFSDGSSNPLMKNVADATKQFSLDLSGLTTSTNVVMAVPNSNFTPGGLALNQTWSGANTFTGTSTLNVTNGDQLDVTGSLTGSNASSGIRVTTTWNTTGNPTVYYANVTNTASGSTSDLAAWFVSSTKEFEVTKGGNVNIGGSTIASTGSSIIIGNNTTNINVEKASVFGSNDNFIAESAASTGYNAFENEVGLGLIFSTITTGQPIKFAPNRTVVGQFFGNTNFAVGSATDNNAFIQIGANTTTNASMFFNGASSDVSSPTNGMLWYNSTAHTLNFRDNSVTTNLLATSPTLQQVLTNGSTLSSNFSISNASNPISISNISMSGMDWGLNLKTSNYTLTATDNVIYIDATTATDTITLPSALSGNSGFDHVWTIVRLDNTAGHNAVLYANGGLTIGTGPGAVTSMNLAVNQSVTVIGYNASLWGVLNNSNPSNGLKANADLTGQTGAVGTVASYVTSSGYSNNTYRIGGYINVTAISLDVIQLRVTWTDETNTSQTQSFFVQGATTGVSAIGFSGYSPIDIRVKGGTTITVATVLTTGTGSITYDVGASIAQVY